MGIITPSSINQFVTSSGPPVTMPVGCSPGATSGLTKEQAEEIFLLTHEVQALGRKLTCKLHPVVSPGSTIPAWGSRPPGMKKLPVGHPIMSPHITQ